MNGALTTALLFVVAATRLFGGDNVPQPFPDLVPSRLVVTTTGGPGSLISVELKDRKVLYSSHPHSIPVVIEPTLNQWSQFIADLNAAKVYKWGEKYENPASTVGFIGWHFDIEVGERHLNSQGLNSYPPDGDLSTHALKLEDRSYSRMMRAVNRLIGRDFDTGHELPPDSPQ